MAEKKDVVISGISGRLPECDNVEEFWKALYDGIDLVTTDDKRYPGKLWFVIPIAKNMLRK